MSARRFFFSPRGVNSSISSVILEDFEEITLHTNEGVQSSTLKWYGDAYIDGDKQNTIWRRSARMDDLTQVSVIWDYIEIDNTDFSEAADWDDPIAIEIDGTRFWRDRPMRCGLYPLPACSNCGRSCEEKDNQACPDWIPCRGAHPSTPNPCECSSWSEFDLCPERACQNCPHAPRS